MASGIKGEIDLDGDGSAVLVLVGGEDAPGESPGFGKPENAVTPEKRRNLARRAPHFLAERRIREAACRLDVLAIESRTGRRPLVRLPKGAFGAKGKTPAVCTTVQWLVRPQH
jgi:Holliday junction resolvase-like predicted endonuclease